MTVMRGNNNQKNLDSKKAFQPYHALHVPKETNLRSKMQQTVVDATTLMLRNIPNKYTQSLLKQEIDDLGFAGLYDFFYLPMDKQNRSNVGYAFINFLQPASATKCWSVLSNYKFQRYHSRKICAVSPAHLQGFEKNVEHFQDRAVMNARKNEKYRPMVLRDGAHIESQALKLDLDKALFGALSYDQPNADLFEPCYVEEGAPDVDLCAKMKSALDLSDFGSCEDLQPKRLPNPNLETDVLSPTLQNALSAMLQPKFITPLSKAPGSTTMFQEPPPGLGAPLVSSTRLQKPPGLLASEDPKWIVPQTSGKLQMPPGLQTSCGISFDENDATPRTNHSYLADCLGPIDTKSSSPIGTKSDSSSPSSTYSALYSL